MKVLRLLLIAFASTTLSCGTLQPVYAQLPVQYPVIGNISGIAGTPIDTLQVRFSLFNCGGANPQVPGVTRTVASTATFTANSSGDISAAIWGNDVITCNGSASTLYQITYLRNNIPAGNHAYYRIAGPFNLNTAAPVTVMPSTSPLASGLSCPTGQALVGVLPNLTPVCGFLGIGNAVYAAGAPSPMSCTGSGGTYVQTDAAPGANQWICVGGTWQQQGTTGPLTGFVTPTNTTNLAASIMSCPSGFDCTVSVNPSYTVGDTLPVVSSKNIAFHDSRNGINNWQYNNWSNVANPRVILYDTPAAHKTQCVDRSIPGSFPIAPGGYSNIYRLCQFVVMESYSPGYSLSSLPSGFAGGWQLSQGMNSVFNYHGEGIRGGVSTLSHVFGFGDFSNQEIVIHNAGRTAGSDEGVDLHRMGTVESPAMYTGMVVTQDTAPSTSTGLTSILTQCTDGLDKGGGIKEVCQVDNSEAQATGLYLAETTPFATSFIHSVTPNGGSTPYKSESIIIDPIPAEMVSTAWGTLTSPCSVPQTAANTGGSCTFTVAVGSGTFTQDSLVKATGWFENQSFIANVTTSGSVATITMNAHHSIPTGAEIYQGWPKNNPQTSCTGTGVDLTANDVLVLESGQTLKYLYDVFGCKSTTTAQVGSFQVGQTSDIDLGQVTLQQNPIAAPVTSVAGLVTVATAGSALNYVNQTISINDSTHTQFNGPCTNVTIIDSGHFTCTSPAAGTYTDTSTTGYVTVGTTGYGNGNIKFYRMARTLDIRSPLTNIADGSFILEPNEMHLTYGTEVFQAHYPAQQSHLTQASHTIYDPYYTGLSESHGMLLNGMFGAGVSSQNNSGVWHVSNVTPLINYKGFGGNLSSIPLVYLHGLFDDYFEFDPPANGNPITYVRCPLSALGCNDPNYFYYENTLLGQAGSFQPRWIPQIASYCLQITGAAYSTLCIDPNALSTNKPLNMNSHQINNVADPVSPQDATNLRTMQASIHRGTIAVPSLASGACGQYTVTVPGTISATSSFTPSAQGDPGNVSAVGYFISGTTAGLRVCAIGAASNAVTFNLAVQ